VIVDIDRAAAHELPATTDEPLPDLVGREGE